MTKKVTKKEKYNWSEDLPLETLPMVDRKLAVPIRYAYSWQVDRETWRKEDNKVYKPYVVCL